MDPIFQTEIFWDQCTLANTNTFLTNKQTEKTKTKTLPFQGENNKIKSWYWAASSNRVSCLFYSIFKCSSVKGRSISNSSPSFTEPCDRGESERLWTGHHIWTLVSRHRSHLNRSVCLQPLAASHHTSSNVWVKFKFYFTKWFFWQIQILLSLPCQ